MADIQGTRDPRFEWTADTAASSLDAGTGAGVSAAVHPGGGHIVPATVAGPAGG
jgi:hypothetical protein